MDSNVAPAEPRLRTVPPSTLTLPETLPRTFRSEVSPPLAVVMARLPVLAEPEPESKVPPVAPTVRAKVPPESVTARPMFAELGRMSPGPVGFSGSATRVVARIPSRTS